MKKMLMPLAVILMLTTGCSGTSATMVCPENKNEIVSVAKDYVHTLIVQDYESASTFNHDDAMKKAIEEHKYEETLKPVIEKLGELKEVSPALCGSDDTSEIITFPVKFENNEANINVVFNLDGKITDINLTKYAPAK